MQQRDTLPVAVHELRWRLSRIALAGAPADALATLMRMLRELCERLATDHFWVVVMARCDEAPTAPGRPRPSQDWYAVEVIPSHDWPAEIRAMQQRCLADSPTPAHPTPAAFLEDAGHDRVHLTREAQDALGGHAEGAELLEKMDVSHRLTAASPLAADREVFFLLDRVSEASPFEEEDGALVTSVLPVLRPIAAQACRLFGWIDADASLTPREREVLSLLLEGLSEPQCGERLGITASSAHQLVVRVYRKLGVTTRAELMARWLQATPPLELEG